MKTDYYKELKLIQDSEINFEISCFWDSQWEFKLGDPMNGYIDNGAMDNLDDCINELIKSIHLHYPKSKYVKDKSTNAEEKCACTACPWLCFKDCRKCFPI